MEFEIATGHEFQQYTNEIAALRMLVFKEYPYLYDGDMQTELDHLNDYSKSKNSILIIVKDEQKVIGAVTGIPLAEVDEVFLTPFAKNEPIDSIFHLGEILLLKEYRGKGIGYKTYKLFEDLVREKKQYNKIAIIEVVRDQDDPRKPKNYISARKFWEKMGYTEHPKMVIHTFYKEVDSPEKVPHTLVYSFKDM